MLRHIGLVVAITCGSLIAAAQQGVRPSLHLRRENDSDLEISGQLKDVPAGESRFVSRAFILSLPQVAVTMKRNEDFAEAVGEGIPVRGVYLDVLAAALGASGDGVAIEAACRDGYTSTYSPDYLRLHRPIFVTAMDGLSPHDWAVKHHAYDAGPYLIGYDRFQPAFRVLAHTDRPAEPAEILRLGFLPEQVMYETIAPPVSGATSQVMDGYTIAKQNCFRCHNAAGRGGTKAMRTWSTLGGIASTKPEWFAAWVHNPQSIDPKAKMPPNLEYDRATLDALTRYFATFAAEAQ